MSPGWAMYFHDDDDPFSLMEEWGAPTCTLQARIDPPRLDA
jgi:hypothetical protein